MCHGKPFFFFSFFFAPASSLGTLGLAQNLSPGHPALGKLTDSCHQGSRAFPELKTPAGFATEQTTWGQSIPAGIESCP